MEQLWKYLRSHASGNRYYETLEEVTESVSLEIKKLAKDRNKVKQMFFWHSIREAFDIAEHLV